jgi:hypothetical protein
MDDFLCEGMAFSRNITRRARVPTGRSGANISFRVPARQETGPPDSNRRAMSLRRNRRRLFAANILD